MKKKIVILGSTGSIGKSLIKILQKHKKNYEIMLLVCNSNYRELLKQVDIFDVKNIVITDHKVFLLVKKKLSNKKINIFNTFDCFNKIFNKKIDYVMSAISGFDGLKPTIDIIKHAKIIALANKESIICGWSLISKNLKKYNTQLIPIDSEHFSIWSLMNSSKSSNVEKVFITASGGPFKNLPLKNFKFITQKQALKHPNWSMGKKISIDSATMMNKVFEIIEAKKIFNFKYSQLDILIHSKSYVHAMIKFSNGLIKILAHETNMKIPIFNSLYPHFEKKINSKKINLNILSNLDFQKVDHKKFPLVKLIKLLPEKDTLFETVIVSANDCLVENFLNKKIEFLDIERFFFTIINSKKFQKYRLKKPLNIEEIISLNKYVRFKTNNLCV
ncbi:1-deoxy-D-xylulose-5-phosphate reductoisomerase [Candidatus Pelagibacter sp.]|nr:1-deoxy-D-xylulose-5-phosphate reductoisomerase [Candidatus Pelagibacter sp.]